GAGSRVRVVKSVHHRQQHQERRLEQVGHHGGQVVVVAETNFRHAHRVVFVDDRQHVPLEEREDRIASVEVAGAVVEVAGRQQNLGGVRAVARQKFVGGPHQKTLANGG